MAEACGMTRLTSGATSEPGELATTSGTSRAAFTAWGALLVVWLVWGSTYLAIRVADRSIPPFAMAAARYLTAGAVLYPLALLGGRRRPPSCRRPLPAPAARRGSRSGAGWR
jgi:hypothetical protein